MKTYHNSVYMPQDKLASVIGKSYRLKYSSHAIESLGNDRNGKITPLRQVTIRKSNVIELTANDFGNVCKLLLRENQDDLNDVCLVIIPDFNEAFVKTLWLCKVTDTHETLKRELYPIK